MGSLINRVQGWWRRWRCCSPPPQVTGLTAEAGGGSGEVMVTWDPLPPTTLVRHYRVYQRKGTGSWWLLAVVTDDVLGLLVPGKLGIVDAPDYWPWPTIGIAGDRCYAVAAVSTDGLEGPMSTQACGTPI